MASEYLSVPELSTRIKYTEQSIYNLIWNKTFIEGIHFFKPTPKKILFKWQAIIEWVEGKNSVPSQHHNQSITNYSANTSTHKTTGNLITI